MAGDMAGLAPGRYVRLAVADTGAGMDAATLARAAEPFFTTKGPGAGTGLGLPMAKGFAEQSGGALRVESIPAMARRSAFGCPRSMRRDSGRRRRATQARPKPTPLRGRRVLLVDDEAVVREVLAEQLEEAGYRVLAAASGTEALALLAAGTSVDALVTDLTMPGIGGLAVIRAAQERYPGLPAVLLTGYAGDGAALAVGGAVSGSFSLLRKPVSGDTSSTASVLVCQPGQGRAPISTACRRLTDQLPAAPYACCGRARSVHGGSWATECSSVSKRMPFTFQAGAATAW